MYNTLIRMERKLCKRNDYMFKMYIAANQTFYCINAKCGSGTSVVGCNELD